VNENILKEYRSVKRFASKVALTSLAARYALRLFVGLRTYGIYAFLGIYYAPPYTKTRDDNILGVSGPRTGRILQRRTINVCLFLIITAQSISYKINNIFNIE